VEETEEDEEAEKVEETEEDEEAEKVEETEEEEVEEIIYKGTKYYLEPKKNIIYSMVDDDIGEEIGIWKNNNVVLNKCQK
jgi:hypothetical protein